MYYTVYSNQKLNWNAKGIERTLQNVTNLLNTFCYEVAYDRTLGRNTENIDKPFNKLVPALIAETYDLIGNNQPGVKVKDVSVNIENSEPIIKVVVDVG